jgi:hypothetical protein
MMPDKAVSLCSFAIALAVLAGGPLLAADPHDPQPVVATNVEISYGDPGTYTSLPGVRQGQADGPKDSKPLKQLNNSGNGRPGGGGGGSASDPVAQSTPYTSVATVSAGVNFEGLGNGFGGFSVDSAPPDTNGAVGATQYVQWVNESFEIFSKAGTPLQGPVAGNQLFQALGANHPCAINNDGDPVVGYDKANNRWILTQFSVTNGSSVGYWQCIAVSKTSDAKLDTGGYNVYAFRQPNFNDYPKFGVWNGVYYAAYNMFKGNTFAGARLCAYDGNAMRAGTSAQEQCFQLPSAYGGILPADVDGSIQPVAGSSEYFIGFGTDSLLTWRFHVDFSQSSNSTLNGPFATSVAAFTEACGGGTCIPQPGTSQQLDSLGDRLMYRLSYRQFGDGHEALFVNHSVNPGYVAAGARWYELRPAVGGTSGVTVAQQSTYAPKDGLSRWMGSIASDKTGDLALGYSASGSSTKPSIYYSFRSPSDNPSLLGSEKTLYVGTGSQQRTLNRWGDYSEMTIDPADDCTFWYTNEYLAGDGTFNWHTRIGSFKINSCK